VRTYNFDVRPWFLVFLLVVLASRIPLLGNGFGSDPDAWRNASAAIRFHESGRYTPSRQPGFPVVDAAVTLLIPFGSVATNLLSVISGVVAVIILFDLAKFLRVRHPFVLTFLFAFSGPLWVHSSQTMDYALGVALLMGCYSALLRRRYVVGGVLLALATGCRATTGALVLPALVLLILRREGPSAFLAFLMSFTLGVLAIFAPVFLSQKDHRLTERLFAHVSKSHVTPEKLLDVMRSGLFYLFGKLGTLALTLGLATGAITWFLRRFRSSVSLPVKGEQSLGGSAARGMKRPADDLAKATWIFEVGVVVVIGALYLMIPYESAYLIPLFPFALLLVGRLTSRPLVLATAVLVFSDSLVTPLFDTHRLIPGRLFVEVDRRRADLDATEALVNRLPARRTIYVTGRFHALRLLALEPSLERTEMAWESFYKSGVGLWSVDRKIGYAAFLDPSDRARLEASGYDIEDLPPES